MITDPELSLTNAQKLRDEIASVKPKTTTQFDLLCRVGLRFIDLLLEQHIAELKKKPQNRLP